MFPSASYTLFVTVTILASAGIDLVGANRQTPWNLIPFVLPPTGVSEFSPVKNVAIIGAGAGGTSAAYFLNQYAKTNPYGPQIKIQVFEKSGRVGGRAMPRFFGSDHGKYELGASALVAENFNLMVSSCSLRFGLQPFHPNASRDFGIELEPNRQGDSSLGLYNGKEFVALLDSSWSNKVAFYYRYGWGQLRANRFANFIKTKFLKLYDESVPPYESIEEMLQRVDLLQYVTQTSKDVLINEWSAGPVYTDELFQALSRNIYASNHSLHALAGAISLIPAQGSYTALKGNDQFFIKYLERSAATLHLNSTVTKITRVPGDLAWNRYKLEVAGVELDETFDAVILATPFHQSNITVRNLEVTFKEVPYRDVYVAVVEDALLDPAFFNLEEGATLPSSIYGFNSSYPFTFISNDPEARRVGIESVVPLTIELLASMFTTPLVPSQLTFKHWKAYPVMDVKAPPQRGKGLFPPITLGPAFYYVNAAEPAISCMEVAIMSARNIVRLLLKDL
ncbi:hypothetical protein L0F63_005716 [Massospora cicadina]|nr:hypothetical protein L0F63_005716 [Massospora cicadina]